MKSFHPKKKNKTRVSCGRGRGQSRLRLKSVMRFVQFSFPRSFGRQGIMMIKSIRSFFGAAFVGK